MKSLAIVASLLLASALMPGCSSTPLLVGAESDSGSPGNSHPGNDGGGTGGGVKCASVGGTCLVGGNGCVSAGASYQDCDTPAGSFCCVDLNLPDAGPPVNGVKCAAAGGTCVIGGNLVCPTQAPVFAQDCNLDLNPGGASCCIGYPDGGPAPDAGDDGGTVNCASVGGQCVAVVPSACAGGTVLDGAKYSCGPGVGTECCLPGQVDGGTAGPFACGTALVCDGRTQVCEITEGGAMLPDGGLRVGYRCIPIPSSCANDVTCACVKPATSTQVCSESSGDVTVTLAVP